MPEWNDPDDAPILGKRFFERAEITRNGKVVRVASGTMTRDFGQDKPAKSGHYFEIKQNKAGEYVAYFNYNSEKIFWTEGYTSKASAKNAIESILKNGPKAEIRES